jgi:hypothetical protein
MKTIRRCAVLWLALLACGAAFGQGTPSVSSAPETLTNRTIACASNTLTGLTGPCNDGWIYATDYGVSTGSSDNGAALNSFFAACTQANTTCVLPNGIFEVQTPLVINTAATVNSGQTATGASVTIVGSGSGPGQFNPSINTTGNGTYLYWGAGSSSGPMLSILGIAKVVMKNFALSGSHVAQDVVWVNQGVASGNLAPYGYDFDDMVFTNAASGYAAFEIGGTQNTARFHFLRDYFDTNTGSIGYRSNVNYNALDMLFESCAFGGMGPSNQGTYGFQINAGSATLIRPEFALSTIADINFTGGGGLTLIDPYTEQSKRFLVSPDTYDNSPLTIIGGDISSYPYAYYKAGYGSAPANTPDQYAAIVYNHSNAPLTLVNAQFLDPSNGTWAVTMTGLGVQQQQSGVVAPYQWTNIGSKAMTGAANAFTSTVFYDINNNVIQNMPAASSANPTLLQSGIPFILSSSGSVGNNCAITGLTSLPHTYASAFIWMKAGAIATSSTAGWYYFVSSSATAGACYNNTYTTGAPVIPASPTAFSTTGPGAFTQTTGSNITGPVVVVPGGSMSINGELDIDGASSSNNTAGAKQVNYTFGGSGTCYLQYIQSQVSAGWISRLRNRGVTGLQVALCQSGGEPGVSTNVFTYSSVDTTANQNLSFLLQLATATDYIVLEGYSVKEYQN